MSRKAVFVLGAGVCLVAAVVLVYLLLTHRPARIPTGAAAFVVVYVDAPDAWAKTHQVWGMIGDRKIPNPAVLAIRRPQSAGRTLDDLRANARLEENGTRGWVVRIGKTVVRMECSPPAKMTEYGGSYGGRTVSVGQDQVPVIEIGLCPEDDDKTRVKQSIPRAELERLLTKPAVWVDSTDAEGGTPGGGA